MTKKHLLILWAVVAVGVSGVILSAAGTNGTVVSTNSLPADEKSVIDDLNGIVVRINAKLEQGKKTAADLADNLKEFDALYARHRGEPIKAVVQILLAKLNLYGQVLDDPERAVTVLKQIQQDYPGIQINGNTDELIESLQKEAEARKIQSLLVVGAPFPNFEEKDLGGKPLSVAGYKGKVVLIDFWATWCPLCVAELPDVLATYKKYHSQGFEVVGISLDEDRPQLEKFVKARGLAWPQYNDGLFWKTKLALKYGIQKLPSTYLLDRNGTIIGKDLFGDDLSQAVAKALASK